MGRRRGIPGLSFSWKRAIGITAARQRLARRTGFPTTRAGLQRKVGAAAGCMFSFVIGGAFLGVILLWVS